MKKIKFLSVLAQRFKEPSTWATISVILVGFGLAGPEVDRVVQIGLGVATIAAMILGILLPEGSADKDENIE